MSTYEGVSYFLHEGGYLPHTIREHLRGMEAGSLFHSLVVGYTVDIAARHVELAANEQTRMALYGHDIMKKFKPYSDLVALSDPFTDEQKIDMQKHPEDGYAFWINHGLKEDAALIVRHHHERFDGKGYPSGLTGDELPLITSLLTVADTVDAMIDPARKFRKTLSLEDALRGAQALSGTVLHPLAVDVFLTTQPYWNNDMYKKLQKVRQNIP